MALINCPECETEISDSAPACPKCGFPVAGPPASPASWLASSNLNGWLRVPMFWLPFMVIRALRGFNAWSDKEGLGIVQTLGTSDEIAGFLVLGHLMLMFLFAVGLVMFFREKKLAPPILITAFSVQLAVIMLTIVEYARSTDDFGATYAWEKNWPIIFIAIILIIYFVRSKRVKETFVK